MNRPDAWNPLREFTDARDRPGAQRASLPTAKSSTLPTPAIRCCPSCRKEPPYEPSRCLEPAA
ncbi:hypothetical protein BHS30_29175 [Klebsiella pneumoniae]|nr:hypothetical protein BHS30_29175 [Klebsiella pneumoniae]